MFSPTQFHILYTVQSQNYRWQNRKEYKGKTNWAQSALARLLWLLYRLGSTHSPHMYPTPGRACWLGMGAVGGCARAEPSARHINMLHVQYCRLYIYVHCTINTHSYTVCVCTVVYVEATPHSIFTKCRSVWCRKYNAGLCTYFTNIKFLQGRTIWRKIYKILTYF